MTDLLWKLIDVFLIGVNANLASTQKLPLIGEKLLYKSLGVYPWILALILLASLFTLFIGFCRNKSFDARRIYHSMKRKLFMDAFLRFTLEIYLKLFHQSLSVTVWFGVASSAVIYSFHAGFMVICLVILIAITTYIAKNREKFDKKEKT